MRVGVALLLLLSFTMGFKIRDNLLREDGQENKVICGDDFTSRNGWHILGQQLFSRTTFPFIYACPLRLKVLQNGSNPDTKETARLLHLDALVQVTVVLASAAVFGSEKQIKR